MSTLILTVVLGLFFAYFAVANTQSVDVNLGNNFLTVPIFMLVIASVLIGLLISAVISSFDWLSSSFALHSRDNQIKQKEAVLENLEHKVRDLEIENSKLKAEKETIITEKPKEIYTENKPSFFDRFRYHPTA